MFFFHCGLGIHEPKWIKSVSKICEQGKCLKRTHSKMAIWRARHQMRSRGIPARAKGASGENLDPLYLKRKNFVILATKFIVLTVFKGNKSILSYFFIRLKFIILRLPKIRRWPSMLDCFCLFCLFGADQQQKVPLILRDRTRWPCVA